MHDIYENPLCKRYASREMQEIFSDDHKFSTWRKLWVALAEAEKELGLDITDEQISEMKAHLDTINYEVADKREHEVRHDVMAHIYAFGMDCPSAKPIIHLGATSCYVGDNTDIIVQREALIRIKGLVLKAMNALCDFAEKNKDVKTLAYTHFQAAQPTTVGKRACLWLQDLAMDLEHIDFVIDTIKPLGCKGTTGTGASFLELFEGDSEKVRKLETLIANKIGFDSALPISGQTYTRKIDYFILSVLSGLAQSAMKFSGDIRLMSHMKEVDEPFESGQVGSSAMAYKRNPMRSERITSLARYIIADTINPAMTAGTQWLERTLDDSANRRISLPEAFLAADGIMTLYINIVSGMTVYPKVMEKHLMEELPFMATENILMECVKRGGDRQTLHEAIRQHAVAAGKAVKLEGIDNDLLKRIADDPVFGLTEDDIAEIIAGRNITGMASEQAESYVKDIRKILDDNKAMLESSKVASVNV